MTSLENTWVHKIYYCEAPISKAENFSKYCETTVKTKSIGIKQIHSDDFYRKMKLFDCVFFSVKVEGL